MLSRLLGRSTYQNLLFTGYLGLAAGLPLSKIALSLSTIWILLLTLLEADFSRYATRIRQNSIIQILLIFLALHLLSFLWSSDMKYALHDLNIKLPLYTIPLVFIVQPPIPGRQVHLLLGTFLAAMLFTSVFNFGSYQHWWGDRNYDDIRGMSLFLSHIRYALMITMSAVVCIAWWRNKDLPFRPAALVLFLWFAFYTYYSQILSGVMTFAGVLIVLLILEVIRRKNKWFTLSVSLAVLALVTMCALSLHAFFKPEPLKISLDNLPVTTKEGNLYLHYKSDKRLENGYPIFYFLCQEEMKREWNKRSVIPYDSLDQKGQVIEATIIRYITSKGWRKDAEGVKSLSEKDIRNIEKGIPTSVRYKTGFFQRLNNLRAEMLQSDPNGYSVSQRFEYWKTGLRIIANHWLTGVGAGDTEQAFQQQYDADKSLLFPQNRLRSHNQFISYTISFGIAGLFLFGWLLTRSWKYFYSRQIVTGLLFMTIAILSFLVEDTLETQMGVTFFAFFWGLFLSAGRTKEKTFQPSRIS